MQIIIIIIAILLILGFIQVVVLPVAFLLLKVIAVGSLIYGMIVSLHSFFAAVKENMDPYLKYVDKSSDLTEGIKRNYFFGPGFYQIQTVITDVFKKLGRFRTKLKDWRDSLLTNQWFINIWIQMAYYFSIFCSQILGYLWALVFSALLGLIIIAGMIVFFTFFFVLWLFDRAVLVGKSIHTRCPHCKRKSVIPVFECPTCGLSHKKLVPGAYGVLKRKCVCGTRLSTTFMWGRSSYKASCPYCGTDLHSSGSKQFGIQLIGGVSSGKTSYLAAFWHEYKKWMDGKNNLSYREIPAEAFEELESWYEGGVAEATRETNASMYSIIHSIANSTSVQMTIYDIAGEVFSVSEPEIQQQQFRYCEGFLILIDPTASPSVVASTITNFVNFLDRLMGKSISKLASVPTAVIITKSDLFKKDIGYPHIRSTFNKISEAGYDTPEFREHFNDSCRDFLTNRGYTNAINLLEAEFSNLRYYPVSAIGHSGEEGAYESWGVLEPVFWLMGQEKSSLKSLISEQ